MTAAGGQANGGQAATDARPSAIIVEDNRPLAEALAERLALDGFEATVATTAKEGRRSCAEKRHNVAFVDLMLPDSSGAVLAAELKREFPKLKIVLMTGFAASAEELLQDCPQLDAALPKPWKAAELTATLEAIRRQQQ